MRKFVRTDCTKEIDRASAQAQKWARKAEEYAAEGRVDKAAQTFRRAMFYQQRADHLYPSEGQIP